MNQKWLITIIIVVILVGLIFWASDREDGAIDGPGTLLSDDDGSLDDGAATLTPADTLNDNPDNSNSDVMQEDDNTPDTQEVTSGPGSYEDYSPEKVAKAEDGQVVLFFHAAWCPTCKVLERDINANSANIPTGLSILKVDYDNSTSLKQKYGVTYQHTMVQVDKDGKLIKRWSGSPTLATLVSQVQK